MNDSSFDAAATAFCVTSVPVTRQGRVRQNDPAVNSMFRNSRSGI